MTDRDDLQKSFAEFSAARTRTKEEERDTAQVFTTTSIWHIREMAEGLFDPKEVDQNGVWRYFGYSKPDMRFGGLSITELRAVLRAEAGDEPIKQLEELDPAFWVIMEAPISEKALRRERRKGNLIYFGGDQSPFSKTPINMQIAVAGTEELAGIKLPDIGVRFRKREGILRMGVKPNPRILLADGIVENIKPAAENFPLDRFVGQPDSPTFLIPEL